MKFSCIQENLYKGLLIVNHIAERNATLPILNNILLEANESGLELSSTNLEIGIKCNVRGKTDEVGKTTVQAKLLTDYVNFLKKDKIDVELSGNILKVSCEGSCTNINTIPADDFPIIPEIEKKIRFVVKSLELKKAIQQVGFAATLDELRPEISGVLFKFDSKLTVVATDSYRLAEKEINLESVTNNESEINVIVPVRTLQEVSRALGEIDGGDVEVWLSDNQISFSVDGVELVSRLIEGKYPDYRQIIPSKFKTTVKIGTGELVKAIKTASLFCRAGINDVGLEFSVEDQEIIVSSANAQVGDSKTKIKAEISGESNKVVLNFRYLVDGLNNLNSNEAQLEIVSNSSPAVLSPIDGDSYLYLIMPIKQ